LENFGKMKVIMDEKASARFVAETHQQLQPILKGCGVND